MAMPGRTNAVRVVIAVDHSIFSQHPCQSMLTGFSRMDPQDYGEKKPSGVVHPFGNISGERHLRLICIMQA